MARKIKISTQSYGELVVFRCVVNYKEKLEYVFADEYLRESEQSNSLAL